MSINRESVSTNFISPNKKKYTIFEISSFSQIRVQKSSKMRLDFAVNDFVFFHCHFHVRFLKQHWVVNTFFFCLFCGQNQLQVWRKCFSKEKTHCDGKKTSPFSSFKSLLVTRKLHFLRNIFRDDARPFVNTSKLVLPKHCFICRTRWQKHFFNSLKNSLFF